MKKKKLAERIFILESVIASDIKLWREFCALVSKRKKKTGRKKNARVSTHSDPID